MISLVQLGAVDYATGLRLQQQLVSLRKEDKIRDVLLLLEHTPVITLGRNAKAANVIASHELLARRGVEVFDCDRGGDVTFHGPGQIVGYPIFDLRGYARVGTDRVGTGDLARPAERSSAVGKHLGVVDFLRRLEEVLIRTCADFAIPAKRIPSLTGVWTDPSPLSSRAEQRDGEGHDLSRAAKRPHGESASAAEAQLTEAKIAALGIHISRSVTSHGFALNVNTDLSYFDLIIPCGITSKPVASMQQQLGRKLDMSAVAESISRNTGVVFQSQILWVETLDALLGHPVGVPLRPPAELRQIHEEDDQTWA